MTDYYKSGEVALIGTIVSADVSCSQRGGFNGQVVAYYKDGTIKRKEPWQYGKLNGVVIFYDQEGNEVKREEYVKGNLIEGNKFSVSTDNPLIGMWKYVEYYDRSNYTGAFANIPPSIKQTLIAMFSQNGILEITVRTSLTSGTEKTNWKYIPKSDSSGVLEQYQGDEMLYRGNVRWLNGNQFVYTNTFHQNPNMVGTTYTYTRQ